MPRIPDRPDRPLTETQLGQLVRAKLHAEGVHMWRNNTGKLMDHTGRIVTFGLGVGSPDLVGAHPIIITPEMVGSKVAILRTIELKTTRSLTPDQVLWERLLRSLGAYHDVVRAVSDLEACPYPPAAR